MKLFVRNYIVAAALLLFGSAVLYAQNAGQFQQTLVGNEAVQIYPSNTGVVVYTSTSNLRDGRGWIYNAPLTGFTLVMTPLQSVVSLNPAGTIAAGTITLPPTVDDGKTVSIFTSATITALTINTSNSATFVPGVITTLTAGNNVSYVYDKANNQWHRFE